ncbi:DUF3310 domain-containing protein [bacterium]|nr:DUF3310 domain-containing protein [bacterium]
MGSINYWLREPPEQDDVHYSESITDNDYREQELDMEAYFDDLDLDQPVEYETYADDDIAYKFNENELIRELQDYIDSTYSAHYSRNKFQSTEFIIDCGHGQGFALGNVLKYVQRYGKKDGYNRADLMKVLHYALIALYNHDHEESIDEI